MAKKRVGRKQRRRAKSRNRNKHTRLVDREKSLFSSFHSFPFWQCRQCHWALFNINIQIVSHSLAFNIYTKNQKTKKETRKFHTHRCRARTHNEYWSENDFFLFFSLFDRRHHTRAPCYLFLLQSRPHIFNIKINCDYDYIISLFSRHSKLPAHTNNIGNVRVHDNNRTYTRKSSHTFSF